MKSILFKLAAFLAIPLVVETAVLLHYHAGGKYQTYGLWREMRAFLDGPDDVEFLVLGNSRARRGIDPECLGQTTVLATPGESFVETHAHLKYVLEHTGKRIDTVLLPCGLVSMKPSDFRRGYYWVAFVNDWDVGWRSGDPAGYLARYLKATLLPYEPAMSAWCRDTFTRLTGQSPRATGVDKDRGSFDDYDVVLKRKLIEDDIHVLRRDGLLDRSALYYLEDMLRLLEQHDVRAVFVKFPLTAEYRKALVELAVEQEYPGDRIDALIDNCPRARRLDYQDLFAGREYLFADHHHVNARGRRELTERLIQDLERTSANRRAESR
jgi:hypothetical protein